MPHIPTIAMCSLFSFDIVAQWKNVVLIQFATFCRCRRDNLQASLNHLKAHVISSHFDVKLFIHFAEFFFFIFQFFSFFLQQILLALTFYSFYYSR
jgi:hypothetical protein